MRQKYVVEDILQDLDSSVIAVFRVLKLRSFGLAVVAACIIVAWVGHFTPFSDLVGSGIADFVVRQSEAYAMVALVIVFWVVFGPNAAADGKQRLQGRSPKAQYGLWIAWLAALIAASIAMATWEGGPGPFVTQKESTAAIVLISWYLGWSRGLYTAGNLTHPGRSIRSAMDRSFYYLAAALLLILSFTGVPMALLGVSFGEWVAENNEAFLAMILIPLYFDIFERPRAWTVTALWYAGLVFAPLAVQMTDQSGWTAEVTEAFIAAIGISLFFDVLRVSAAGQEDATVSDTLATNNPRISKSSTSSQSR